MTQPQLLYIKDAEFVKLYDELSQFGLAVYFPITLTTGAVLGGATGAVIGGLIYHFEQLSDLDAVGFFIVMLGICGALMFVQRYALHGSQNVTHLLLVQALVVIVCMTLRPESLTFKTSTSLNTSTSLVSIEPVQIILILLVFSLWGVICIHLCDFGPLVSIQKIILRRLHRLSLCKKVSIIDQ